MHRAASDNNDRFSRVGFDEWQAGADVRSIAGPVASRGGGAGFPASLKDSLKDLFPRATAVRAEQSRGWIGVGAEGHATD